MVYNLKWYTVFDVSNLILTTSYCKLFKCVNVCTLKENTIFLGIDILKCGYVVMGDLYVFAVT